MIDDLLFIVKVVLSPWLLASYLVFMLFMLLLLRLQAKPNTIDKLRRAGKKHQRKAASVAKAKTPTKAEEEDPLEDDLDDRPDDSGKDAS